LLNDEIDEVQIDEVHQQVEIVLGHQVHDEIQQAEIIHDDDELTLVEIVHDLIIHEITTYDEIILDQTIIIDNYDDFQVDDEIW
jgi:hypothetical protein